MVATVKVMTSTSPIATLDLVAAVLAATLYQGNLLRDICADAVGMLLHIKHHVLLISKYFDLI